MGSPAAAAAAAGAAAALSTCCPQADRAADTGLAPVRPFSMRAGTSFSSTDRFSGRVIDRGLTILSQIDQ